MDNVIVIDDGSTDRTGEMAQLAGAHVIYHKSSMGKGAAIKSGFDYVRKNGARVIVMIDTEGENDPEIIPKLINPILKGEADVVNGCSHMHTHAGLHSTDMHGNIQAFSRHTLSVFKFKSNGKTTEEEILREAETAGLRVKEIEIGVKQRVHFQTEKQESNIIKSIVRVLEDIELSRPLYYLTIPGMLCAVIGIGLGLDMLNDFFMGEILKYWSMLFMVILSLSGIFMAFTGIILHSISRLINENNKMNHASSSRGR